jgi:ATP-binding cassette subfamily B protein
MHAGTRKPKRPIQSALHAPEAMSTVGSSRSRGGEQHLKGKPLPEDRPASRDIRILGRIAAFLAPYRGRIVVALIALLVAAASVLAIGQALRRVIDFGFGSGSEVLDQYFVALLGIVGVLAVATFGRYYAVSWLGERVVADMRREVYDHVLTLSPAFFESTRIGEILSRLTSDTTLIQTVVGSSASVALRNVLILVGGSILLLVTSPKLTGLVFAVVLLVVIPIVMFGRQVRRLSRASQDRIANVSAYAEESLSAIRTVQASVRERISAARFAHVVEEAFSTAIRQIRARGILSATVILFVFGAVDVVLWIGARDVVAGTMTGGELAAFVFYAIMVAGAVGALSEIYGDLQRAAGATERLVELLSIEPAVAAPLHPQPLPSPPRGEIAFEHVTFRYPSRPGTAALHDLSLTIAPGERVALVGPSGAGKTTVFQLLLRFYDPDSGSVTLDGVALPLASPQEVRGRIGLVPQDPVIFADSVRENIRFARPDASDADVVAAADAAAASGFIQRLPDRFDTQLGEKGAQLSGGQKQRIAIARAILRDPSVLLLDEATSALDAESEHAVQQALGPLMAGRTTIVIAHRLATVLKADRIVVMDEGRIVATGTHEELIAMGGLYARLADLQFNATAIPREQRLPAAQ